MARESQDKIKKNKSDEALLIPVQSLAMDSSMMPNVGKFDIITEVSKISTNRPLSGLEKKLEEEKRKEFKKLYDEQKELDGVGEKLIQEQNEKETPIQKAAKNMLKKLEERETIKSKLIDELNSQGLLKTGKRNKQSICQELHLELDGNLWRESKKKFCYSMGERSDRNKIIRYLATNKGYQQTAEISTELDGKSEQSIRTEIGKIRGNIKKFLKIDGKRVIESKKDSGYKIGAGFKIVIKK